MFLPVLKTVLFFFLGATSFGAEFCSNSSIKNAEYDGFAKLRESKLTTFSTSPPIATQADQLLEALLDKKSPILINWVKRRNLESTSQKQLMKAWRLYFAENLVIRSYQKKPADIKKKIEALIEGIYGEAFPAEKKKHYETLFAQAKSLSIHRIEKLKIADDLKEQIKHRVQSIKLYWLDKLAHSQFADRPLEVFSWGIAYSPVANQINIGVEALKYNNDATVFAVLAHEIGHSFDPCRWGAFFDGQNPFQPVISCLRSSKSVGAKQRDDSRLKKTFDEGKLSLSLKTALEMNPHCNKTEYPPIGIQADQINEAFADWFSAEVLSQSSMLKQGLRQDLCFEKALNPGSSYPKNTDRLLKIYLANPKIASAFQAQLVTKPLYCSM